MSMQSNSKIEVDKVEHENLVKDLEVFSQIDDSKWSDPKVVLSYLVPQRISYYHEVLKNCDKNNVIFDDKVVADFGTCTGYLIRLISQKYKTKKLFGYDINDMFIKLASHLVPEATILKHNLVNTLDKKFDIIFLTQVLEHFTNPEKALLNVYNMLRENGTLVLTIPDGRIDNTEAGNGSIEDIAFSGHINFWSTESFEIFLRKFFDKDKYKVYKINHNNIFALIQK